MSDKYKNYDYDKYKNYDYDKYKNLKSKYKNLKSKYKKLRGGNNNVNNDEENIKILDDLYEGYFSYSIEKETVEKYSNYSFTYGELTYRGLKTILEEIKEKISGEIRLIDLGSGNGKIPIMAVLFFSIAKSTGIELSKLRHGIAIDVLAKLDEKHKENITMLNKDIFNINDKELAKYNVIFISNLCFNDELNSKLYEKLKNINNNTLIILSKAFPENNIFTSKKIENVEMTWNKSSHMYMYQKIN